MWLILTAAHNRCAHHVNMDHVDVFINPAGCAGATHMAKTRLFFAGGFGDVGRGKKNYLDVTETPDDIRNLLLGQDIRR